MTATRPGQGPVVSFKPGAGSSAGGAEGDFGGTSFSALSVVSGDAAVRTGLWRPNTPFQSGAGLQVSLRREEGVTGDVLLVPLRLQTPVIGDFERPYEVRYSTYETIDGGQQARHMGRKLLDVSLRVILMDPIAAAESDGLVVWGGRADPQRTLDELRWIAGEKRGATAQRFRLVVAQPAVWGNKPLINIVASITGITASQNPGEAGTEYVTLRFLEDPRYVAQRGRRRRHYPATKLPILDGDTLHAIARRSHFARASAWRIIAKYNGIRNVSPSSAADLERWARLPGQPDRTEIKIPAT